MIKENSIEYLHIYYLSETKSINDKIRSQKFILLTFRIRRTLIEKQSYSIHFQKFYLVVIRIYKEVATYSKALKLKTGLEIRSNTFNWKNYLYIFQINLVSNTSTLI